MICMEDYISRNYIKIRPVDEENLSNLFNNFFNADEKENTIKILEPGCGPGRLLKVLANIPNLEPTGIDIRKDIVRIARNVLNNEKVNIIHGDFLKYDFEKTKYDYILFSHYLHLQNNADKHIKKAKSLLKDNGRLLFLYEDCSYYSLLLGYPPALAEHHPFLQLFRSLQSDDSLKNKFKPSGPYLPHEIMNYCLDGFNLFPVFSSYRCKQEVDWREECENKNASVFRSLSEEDLRKCKSLGESLSDAFQIQPYLFYTGTKVSCDPQFTTSKAKELLQDSKELNANQLFDYLQDCFSVLFKKYQSVFVSTWALHKSAKEDKREVFFAGMIPKSELSNWYYSYKKSLDVFEPEYSPSYVVATKTDYLNPRHPKISLKNLKVELTEFYKSYDVNHPDEGINEYINKSLQPTLNILNSIHKYSNNTLEKLYFFYINFKSQNDTIMPIVVLSTSDLNEKDRIDVAGIFRNCPSVDESVIPIFSPVVRDRIRWIDNEETSLKEELKIIRDEAIKIISESQDLFPSDCHTLQKIINNCKYYPALKENFQKLRKLFIDKDIIQQFQNEADSVGKLYCLVNRYCYSRLFLWDWLDFIENTLKHEIVNKIELRHSNYYFDIENATLNKIFRILNDENCTSGFSWKHEVSSNNRDKLSYKMTMISEKAEIEKCVKLYYYDDDVNHHQNTKIWCHVFQKLFGGPLFQFKLHAWSPSVIYSNTSKLEKYLFITTENENKIIVEGCMQWELAGYVT